MIDDWFIYAGMIIFYFVFVIWAGRSIAKFMFREEFKEYY